MELILVFNGADTGVQWSLHQWFGWLADWLLAPGRLARGRVEEEEVCDEGTKQMLFVTMQEPQMP